MLKNRKEQLGYLSDALEKTFLQRVIVHLRDDLREERLSRGIENEALGQFVERGIVDCGEYGIEIEDEIERYLEYSLLLGPEFGTEFKWASEIMTNEDLSGDAKMNAIGDYLMFSTPEPPL